MSRILFLIASFLLTSCYAQSQSNYNLGFEVQSNEHAPADEWFQWGEYHITIDRVAHSGLRSGKITSDSAGKSFGAIAYAIPAEYKGKKIHLEGFMKIENVQGGFAGLLLRIDRDGEVLVFDNMKKKKIYGTRDWQKYSVTLDYPKNGTTIYVGGVLAGKGEAWFDDFSLKIDNETIASWKTGKEIPAANPDREFTSGSGVVFNVLTKSIIADLATLGRIWGFLKYHHPAIASGNYNWDYELFRFLPHYLSSLQNGKRDTEVLHWIEKFGEIPDCNSCKETQKDAYLQPSLKWITDAGINDALADKLNFIYKNRKQSSQFHVKPGPVGNPVFTNEEAYSQMAFPDPGFRLLAIYRYWNMINYFFPYKYITDKPWDSVLEEYIPHFLSAADEFEYEVAALQLIAEVNDTHANLYGGAEKVEEWKGSFYPSVRTSFVENQLVVTGYDIPEKKVPSGLLVGDVILSVEGNPVNEIVKSLYKYYPASNDAARLRNISANILRSGKPVLSITISRNGQTFDRVIPLVAIEDFNEYDQENQKYDKSFKMLDNNIGYLTLETIKQEEIPEIKKQFADAKGIIIDIRNYPATFVPFLLGSYFVTSPTPFVKFTIMNVNNPGEFNFSRELRITSSGKTFKRKVVVLVNEFTQSQAEYTAMAFRAGVNTTILGSTTAGADGNVSEIFLPGGLRTMISGIGIYYPNGDPTQRGGIVPDVVVKPTTKGIQQGRDELLEKAIEVILQQ